MMSQGQGPTDELRGIREYRCAANSTRKSLSPGGSVVAADAGRVDPPGHCRVCT
jgi:hypothetical protein